MLSQQLQITAFGEPEVLQLRNLELAPPQGNQVLVQVAFSGLNPIDGKTRAGLGWAAAAHKDDLPWTPGYDLSGTVLACGELCQQLQPGDKVAGMIGFPLQGGAYSNYQLVDETQLTRLTPNADLAQAAALPLAGLTAYQALHQVANLQVGQRVWILGAGGGVGQIALQLAHILGAQVWVSANATKHARLRQLGALRCFDQRAGEQPEPTSVDVVLDLIGGDFGMAALTALRDGGCMVTVPTITADAIIAANTRANVRVEKLLVSANAQQQQQLLQYLENDQLQIHIEQRYAMLDAIAAHQRLASGQIEGKIVFEHIHA